MKNVAHSLKFLKMNPPSLREQNYRMLQDQLFADNFNEGVKVSGGGNVILPSSYIGSARYMSAKFHD
jgi:hypothetical protein